jgi:hypothetical protein
MRYDMKVMAGFGRPAPDDGMSGGKIYRED